MQKLQDTDSGWIDGSDARVYIVLDVRPDHVLCALHHARPLVQQRARRLAMGKHCDTSHDRLDRVRVDYALLDAWDEEGRLAAAKVVVEVDEKCEQTRLLGIGRRRIILVCICGWVDA